jgi:hypothetical protein
MTRLKSIVDYSPNWKDLLKVEEANLHQEEKEFLAHRLRKMTMKRDLSHSSSEPQSPLNHPPSL